MKLVSPSKQHLSQIMTWLGTEKELKIWAGPNFRYPFTARTFEQDLSLTSLASFCLIEESSELVAFGQFYDREGRCHLGRLVVNPEYRGQGMVSVLVKELSKESERSLRARGFSLFVLADNLSAIKAYEKLGFKPAEYPGVIPLDNCIYMVAEQIS